MLNAECLDLAKQLLPREQQTTLHDAHGAFAKRVKTVLSQRCAPAEGWSEQDVKRFLLSLTALDGNARQERDDGVAAGEREGRVLSSLVRDRCFGMAHGVGRSGDVAAMQPKAVGSGVLASLTRHMMLSLLRRQCGLRSLSSCVILPCATGMALMLSLLSLPGGNIVWSRIDQKTCVKAMTATGARVHPVQLRRHGDQLCTDVDGIADLLDTLNDIKCVVTTTSCFAPRAADDVLAVGRMCHERGVAHVVNHAYGAMSPHTSALLEKALRSTSSRVDLVVMSTDKNFCVPVGGSVVCSALPGLVDNVAQTYAGRASAAPVLDLCISLLQVGTRAYADLFRQQTLAYEALLHAVSAVAREFNERVLASPRNFVSIAFTLGSTVDDSVGITASFVGSALFRRGLSGARVVAPSDSPKEIGPLQFRNWGSQCDDLQEPYCCVAAGAGSTADDADRVAHKLRRTLRELRRLRQKRRRTACSDLSEENQP